LPTSNGIAGVELDATGSTPGESFPFTGPPEYAQFVFGTSGNLSGSAIPAGALIPFSFSFTADSTNPAGTSITGAEFFFPSLLVQNESSTILFNGYCTPATNTHWCLEEEGSGMLSFPAGYPSGAPLSLVAEIEIDAPIELGAPAIGLLSAKLDLNPVPEPRYPILSLLVVAISLAAWSKGRKRSSAS